MRALRSALERVTLGGDCTGEIKNKHFSGDQTLHFARGHDNQDANLVDNLKLDKLSQITSIIVTTPDPSVTLPSAQ